MEYLTNEEGQYIACPTCHSSELWKKGFGRKGEQNYQCKKCNSQTVSPIVLDKEIILNNIKLAKQTQKFQDLNRVERKAFREFSRIDNTLIELNQKLIDIINKNSFDKSAIKVHKSKETSIGIVHISDIHFNELVSLPHNKYDFLVAAKRFQKLAHEAKIHFSCQGIKKVLIAMTGDMLNSDRRLDEQMSKATNRTKACILGVNILQQFIRDLNKEFNITVAAVSGNEGRVHPEQGWTELVASDNYDFLIFNFLKYLFKDTTVEFVSSSDPSELVINIAGQNLLLLHSHGAISHSSIESSITRIKGRYLSRSIKIDYIIFGHVHSASIGDCYARSGSMVGANDYSEKSLNLESRASQNLYIFKDDGSRHGIKIDLQKFEKFPGYSIDSELAEYNIKSANKLKNETTIFKIII